MKAVAMRETLDKQRLLHGPYRPPALRVGDRTDCLMRGTVIITSWTDARISWPRCRRPVGNSHPSLLLDTELARAVRTEAAAVTAQHTAAPAQHSSGSGPAIRPGSPGAFRQKVYETILGPVIHG
jgi:hypothetical protein